MGSSISTSLRFFLVLLLAAAAVLGAAPQAMAAEQADLQVNLAGPAQSSPNAEFTYTITASNLGPSAADGTRVDYTAPAGATALTVSCGSPTGGAVCGTFTVANGKVTGTLSKLPGNGTATITVRGAFGPGSSASATATITAPAGVTELDSSSNSSTQNTALAQAQVNTTTTASPASVVSGGTVTVTTTFENVGTVPVQNFIMQGSGNRVGPAPYLAQFVGTTVCGASSTVECPPTTLGAVDSGASLQMPFSGDAVTLQPGQKIVFVSQLTVTRSCTTGGTGSGINFTSSYNRDQVADGNKYTVFGTNSSTATLAISGGDGPCPSLRLSKTVDKSNAPSGQERTFTIRLANPTTTDITVGSLYDVMGGSGTYAKFQFTGTVQCAATSTAPCPFTEQGATFTNTNPFSLKNYVLPAGAELVLSIPTTVSAQCQIKNSYASNSVRADNLSFPQAGQIYYDQLLPFFITGLPPCDVPTVTMTPVRTSPQVIGVGEITSDTVTLTNTGTAPTATASILYNSFGATGDIPFGLADMKVVCVQAESTGDCGKFTTITSNRSSSSYVLQPGEKLVLKRTARITSTGTCPPSETSSLRTNYENSYTGEFRPYTYQQLWLFQEIRCNDVTVETTVPSLTPEAGAAFPVAATVSNQVGVARDVAFSMALPANGYVFDPAGGDTITCEVVTKMSTQNVTCPELSYDPATRRVTGTVPVLGAGDSIRIRVNGSAGVVEGKSYPVTTTVKASGDSVPGSNTSVVNFGVANTLVPTFGEVTVNLPAGATLPGDLVFPARMVCGSSGTTETEVRVLAGKTTGRGSLDDTVWRNDDCVVTFQRPEAPAGYEWDGDFSVNPVALDAVQSGATARTAVTLRRTAVPVPSPSATEDPSPEPTSPDPTPSATEDPTPEPTVPVPSPSATEEPSPDPTTPAPTPEPTSPSPTDEPTVPVPSPSATEDPTPEPTPTAPSPEPTSPEPSPSATVDPTPDPTSPVPTPSATEDPTPGPTVPVPTPSATEDPSPEPTSRESTAPVPSPSVTEDPSPEPSAPQPTSGPTTPAPLTSAKPQRSEDTPPGTPAHEGPSPDESAQFASDPEDGPDGASGGIHLGTGFDPREVTNPFWWIVACTVVAAVILAARLRTTRGDDD